MTQEVYDSLSEWLLQSLVVALYRITIPDTT